MAPQCFEGFGCSLGCFAFIRPTRILHETPPLQAVGLQPQVWLAYKDAVDVGRTTSAGTSDAHAHWLGDYGRRKSDLSEEITDCATHASQELSGRTIPLSTNTEDVLWPPHDAHRAFGEVLQVVRDFEDEALREMQEALRLMQDLEIWDDIEERAQEVEGPPAHRGLWQLEEHVELMGQRSKNSVGTSFVHRKKEKVGTRRVSLHGNSEQGGSHRAETPRPGVARPAHEDGHGNWLMALQAETHRRQLAKSSTNREPNTPRPALVPESLGVSHKATFDGVRSLPAPSCCRGFLCPEPVADCVCLEQKSSTVQSCPALGRSLVRSSHSV